LPTEKWDTVVIERDDGGPELRIYKLFTRSTWPMGSGGTVVMDEMGFCNSAENSYQQETIDIIALGDSFTTCHAVKTQDTWSSQLDLHLTPAGHAVVADIIYQTLRDQDLLKE